MTVTQKERTLRGRPRVGAVKKVGVAGGRIGRQNLFVGSIRRTSVALDQLQHVVLVIVR